jgi:hypothetical protein
MNRDTTDGAEAPVQNSWLAVAFTLGALLLAGGLIAGGILMIVLRPDPPEHQAEEPPAGAAAGFPEVTAKEGRLNGAAEVVGGRPVVRRSGEPKLTFRVTLENVKAGEVYPITCEWLAPSGAVAHRNQFHTQPVAGPIWQPHADYQMTRDAEPGVWTVNMKVGNRQVWQQFFEVKP